MNIYYVYALYELGFAEPFYIGKGHGSRIENHFRLAEKPRFPVHKKIASLGRQSVEVIKLHENISEDEANFLEINYINHFGRRDQGTGCLLNGTDGGDGTTGFVLTDAQRAQWSNCKIGHKFSEITKSKMSIAALASWTAERKQKHSKQMIGNRRGQNRNEQLKRPIKQILCGQTIAQYESVNAARRAGYNNLTPVLQKLKSEAYGFQWEYANE